MHYQRKEHFFFSSLPFWVAVVFCLASFHSSAARLYKWIDENGQVRYSDRLPSQQTKKAHQKLGNDGRVLESVKASKTPRQLAEERKAAELAAIEEKKRALEKARQNQRDNVLLKTFSNESEIEHAETERLEVIDSVIGLLKKGITNEQKKLDRLESRAQNDYLDKDKTIPGGLQQNIEYFQDKILSRHQQLENKLKEREKIKQKYADDLQRFRELSSQKKQLRKH